jgi:phosphoribosylglycinamide formyltransferase-1
VSGPVQPPPTRLLVLLSGSGRTLENLLARIADGTLAASIVGVVASRPCRGVDVAERAGVTAEIARGRLAPEALVSRVNAARADLVVLAGYLQLVPVPGELEGRILNIHPALLPAFGGPGMHGHRVHEAVIEAARAGRLGPAPESGCTVHLCDATYDTGAIVVQRRCPVLPTDTPDSLAARVFAEECIAYPEAIARVATRLREARA